MASLLERMQGSAPGPTTPPVRTTSLLERMQRAADEEAAVPNEDNTQEGGPVVSSSGDEVWVPHAGAYARGTVAEAQGPPLPAEQVDVELTSGERVVVARSSLQHLEPSSAIGGGVDDNTMLTHLNEPNLLENLRARFADDIIYTYIGSILVAVNPYKSLPLYGRDRIDQYTGQPRGSNPPHVYAMADRVHRALTAERSNQSIIVSGESGAGKTESCKAIMKFLLTVRADKSEETQQVAGGGGGWLGGWVPKMLIGGRATDAGECASTSLDEKILQTNPILEAFGNAKTLRNNNSSRFGKFVKIHFDSEGVVAGASIDTYLLEKSRVSAISQGERTYHCFYQMCEGASEELQAAHLIRPASEFSSLAASGCCDIDGLNDAENFSALQAALSTIGVDEEKQTMVWKTLSGLLWLGETK